MRTEERLVGSCGDNISWQKINEWQFVSGVLWYPRHVVIKEPSFKLMYDSVLFFINTSQDAIFGWQQELYIFWFRSKFCILLSLILFARFPATPMKQKIKEQVRLQTVSEKNAR